MKLRTFTLSMLTLASSLWSASAKEQIIVLNEGAWQSDNSRLTYFEDGTVVSNEWFKTENGRKLGDTAIDIIQINDNLLAIAVNGSNLIQFITPQGKAVAATENVPNCRKLASDGSYVYVTSYAHECTTVDGIKTFTKGFVAKIDIKTFNVVSAVEVGYEPEGIAYYNGHLFVANSGGYSYQEDHAYEKTVSVIKADDMSVVRTIDTGAPNLYGYMSQSGQYLCINSSGDYYENMGATVIFDCQRALEGKPDTDCFVKLDFLSTYNTTTKDGLFYVVGSSFSFATNGYVYNYAILNPEEIIASGGSKGKTEDFPGTFISDIQGMKAPNCIYVNPYTGYIYATDATTYVEPGMLYQWTPEGKLTGKYQVYINPGHIMALPPDGHFGSVTDVTTDFTPLTDDAVYNLQGIKVTDPQTGEIYIKNGKKFIYRPF